MLFRDSRFVVLNKPAGLPVHPGPRSAASVEDFFPLLSPHRPKSGPWLAHRLDADTAGCLVIALRLGALHEAQSAFASGQARKTYWAVVHGKPAGISGTLRTRLAKHTHPKGWHMRQDANGDEAITDWRTLGIGADIAWLELRPRTGRTHQIRVHCAQLGHPILGDPIYGGQQAGRSHPGLHLLARAIALPLSPPLSAMAEPPAQMRAAFAACGWQQGDVG